MMKRYSLSLLACLLLGACATPANHYDPLEPVNRKIFAFNKAMDDNLLRPVAVTYTKVTPQPVQTGIGNFFSNLQDLYVTASGLLQGKGKQASSDFARFMLNSTLGLAGLIDIATPAGLPKHNEDFGQVLGHWGVPSGPYLVVPFLGPKTLRDTSDWFGTYALSPSRYLHDQALENTLAGVGLINVRAQLLPSEAAITAAAFGDEYGFLRDAYLQRRHSLIWDGKPPAPLPMGVPVEDDDDDLDGPDLPQPAATPAVEPAAAEPVAPTAPAAPTAPPVASVLPQPETSPVAE